MRVLLTAAYLVATISAAYAHGDAEWIQLGIYKDANGNSCCGVNDCHRLPVEATRAGAEGFEVVWRDRVYTIPYQRTLVSENEHFWVCEKSDQTIRCFFAPPMGA